MLGILKNPEICTSKKFPSDVDFMDFQILEIFLALRITWSFFIWWIVIPKVAILEAFGEMSLEKQLDDTMGHPLGISPSGHWSELESSFVKPEIANDDNGSQLRLAGCIDCSVAGLLCPAAIPTQAPCRNCSNSWRVTMASHFVSIYPHVGVRCTYQFYFWISGCLMILANTTYATYLMLKGPLSWSICARTLFKHLNS